METLPKEQGEGVLGDSRIANPSALYRGQKPQNREKRVSESKNPHFLPTPEKLVSSPIIPFFVQGTTGKMGIF